MIRPLLVGLALGVITGHRLGTWLAGRLAELWPEETGE